MSEEVSSSLTNIKVSDSSPLIIHPLSNNLDREEECETAEEVTTDSDEYLSEPLRYGSFRCGFSSLSNNEVEADESSVPVTSHYGSLMEGDVEIPIVGYEVMEERARFTVFKLRIDHKPSGDSWYVFRRYTDFVRLCNKLRHSHSQIVENLPQKRWLGNNFDPVFLEERLSRLQTLVNSILDDSDLLKTHLIQDFFCLNEPPAYGEANEESRALFEAFEDTIHQLKQQLREKDATIDMLQESLHSKTVENENLKKIIKSSTMSCQKCQKDYENISKSLCGTSNQSPATSSLSNF